MDAVPLTSGEILVAGIIPMGTDIVVWDNFGSQNEQKQVLWCEGWVRDIRLSSDGRGLVSRDIKDNVYLWCRGSDDVTFELREKRACSNNWKECFEQLVYSQSKDTPEDLQSPAPQTQADGSKDNMGEELKKDLFFFFDSRTRWVHLMDGREKKRMLWYIPEGFVRYKSDFKFAQRGRKIVVYGPRSAILFEYKDDFVRTLLK